jgi:ABC-type transport system involved in multi-copper enzyme maturation permease subunit
MKYLAILKDSLLEALDTKVFYVMVGLSGLVIAVVASVSYRPVTVETEVKRITDNVTWILSFHKGNDTGGPPSIHIENFQQTNPEAPPWERDYRVTLVVSFPNAEDAKAGKAARQDVVTMLQQSLRWELSYLTNLKVTESDSPDPKELRYEMTTHGTTVTQAKDWPHEATLFFILPIRYWHWPLGEWLHFWEYYLVGWIGAAVSLLISTVITAFFIPNMLHKGTIDLLIVKPIHRTTLFIYKYLGGLCFIFLNTCFVVVGVWLVLGLRTGMWGAGFLVSIPVITFQFALYYAVSTLFGLLTRSPIVAIMMTCLAWVLFVLVAGWGYQFIDQTRKVPQVLGELQEDVGETRTPPEIKQWPDWLYTTADIVHMIAPRPRDLDILTSKAILDQLMPPENLDRKRADRLYANFRWSEALAVTTLYIVVLLALSCWRFATKDY